ncbi:nucleoside-diphosphate sugar epimerase [Shewanella youngdeokensis]|uniref:Nucleoside-diphosphate sugar epimerase n=1 Tax=Shewanella youngdeokensis TaxID=2999068 RepID=A0ABZ0K2V3_9GAMM|nr:nucleoside-diphosphate sugar epimerase [Shewanella sp. DAU334]
MNAAIIGASGLIGQQLLQQLIDSAAYKKIFMLGRRQANYTASNHCEVIFVQCQLSQLAATSLNEKINHAFCCLGTTIKQAGSQQAFTAVDKTAVLDFVTVCQADQNFVITALGANAASYSFYNRVKGETELALETLLIARQPSRSQPQLVLFQPSLLIGPRSTNRPLESFGQLLFKLLKPLFIGPLKSYQPISSHKVATAMVNMALKPDALKLTATQTHQQIVRVHNKHMV